MSFSVKVGRRCREAQISGPVSGPHEAGNFWKDEASLRAFRGKFGRRGSDGPTALTRLRHPLPLGEGVRSADLSSAAAANGKRAWCKFCRARKTQRAADGKPAFR